VFTARYELGGLYIIHRVSTGSLIRVWFTFSEAKYHTADAAINEDETLRTICRPGCNSIGWDV
jgi:hypothetical protein